MEKEKIIVKIDPELEDLIPNYLGNLQTSIDEIKEGLEDMDMDRCCRIGHNLKGSGGSYGFQFVSSMGKEIEDAAKIGEKKKVISAVEDLESYLKQVEITYA